MRRHAHNDKAIYGKTMDILRRLQIHPVGAFLRLIVIH